MMSGLGSQESGGCPDPVRVKAVIDVFRAFTTACHIMDLRPSRYYMTSSGAVVEKLRKVNPEAILVGKPDIGETCDYDAPNSPTLVRRLEIGGRVVIHRTKSGAQGAVRYSRGGQAIGVCFSNLGASARWLRSSRARVDIIPMGLGQLRPTPEDELCKVALAGMLRGEEVANAGERERLRNTSGRCFFEWSQDEYPAADFEHCVCMDRHDFALLIENRIDHALITRG
jgi:2-phosphosulfolactate phosphatase